MGVIFVQDIMEAGKLQEFKVILDCLVSSRPAWDETLPEKEWEWRRRGEKKGGEQDEEK